MNTSVGKKKKDKNIYVIEDTFTENRVKGEDCQYITFHIFWILNLNAKEKKLNMFLTMPNQSCDKNWKHVLSRISVQHRY